MAMTKCKECGADVSDQARACPQCGAVRTPGLSLPRILVGLVIGIVLFYLLGTYFGGAPPR